MKLSVFWATAVKRLLEHRSEGARGNAEVQVAIGNT
jgi:hypothetical protein